MPNKCVQPGIRRRATCRRVGEVSLPLHWTAIEVTMSAVLRVALPLPLPTLFDYLPPAAGEACAGSRVLVPFGRRQLAGVVVAIEAEASVDRHRLKQALRLLDGEALLDARPLPPIGDEYWALTPAGRAAHDGGARPGGSKALRTLLAAGALSAQELHELQPGWREAARRLAAAGLLERSERPPPERRLAPSTPPRLSDEQRQAVAAVGASLDRYQPFLLDGVTGSGKTEVYLALIEQVLAQGRQALLLVPEIGLAPKTVRRLRERLGVMVEVLHSNLAEGDRARAWLRARAGTARVILGTRSAIFTPLPRGGLIIVDEEHDGSYKQQDGFRYHARDLALVRAQI